MWKCGIFRSTLRGVATYKLYFETEQSQKPELSSGGESEIPRSKRNRRNMELRRNFRQTPARGSRFGHSFRL